MAHIQRRKAKKGYTYRVRYVDPDGREKSKTFTRKADAEDFLTEVSHNIRAGAYVDPSAGRQTLKSYLDGWLTHQAHYQPASVANTRSMFRNMIYPVLGARPIGKLQPSDIRSWQIAMLNGFTTTNRKGDPVTKSYAESTVAEARDKLATALNTAVADRRLASNPCAGVKAPRPARERVVPRTVEQIRAGEAKMPPHLRAAIMVDAGTGLRYDELMGLTVDRVDFLRKEITVDRQLVGVRKGGIPVFGPPKTRASNRTVPVPQWVIDAIAAHLAKYPAGEHGLIFTNRYGNPMKSEQWARAWNNGAREAMGLEPGKGLHQVRHFYASLLIAANRPVTEVQERMGHDSARVTLDVYSHLWPRADEGTRAALDAAFEVPNVAVEEVR